MVQRLLQDGHVLRHARRDRRALGHEQKRLILADGDARIVLARIADRELLGVGEGQRAVKRQAVPRGCGCGLLECGLLGCGLLRRGLLRGGAAAQQQKRQQQRKDPRLHSPAACRLADEKFRVYSISWGVLMAVVSPMTVRSVSKASTGISNVEPGSVDNTS